MKENLSRVFIVLISFIFSAYLITGCGGGSSDKGSPPVTPPPVTPPPAAEGLTLTAIGTAFLDEQEPKLQYYGDVYSGTYVAPDGVSIDVWVSVRETDAQTGVGTVERVGVVIQGGTGLEVLHLLDGDEGLHTLWIAINYRGSSLGNIYNAEWECAPGGGFISCLKEHDTFSKINPELNAQDANSVIRLFADDGEITVNGVAMKASEFVPSGTVRSPVNLLTDSFGGVVVSYMLAEENRPELHNVFFEQVTAPSEHPRRSCEFSRFYG